MMDLQISTGSPAADMNIQDLPTEILSMIFRLCKPLSLRDQRDISSSVPLDISLVCRRWRAIALALPELWTAIPASFPRDAALAFLDRSAGRPIDLSIHLPNDAKRRYTFLHNFIEPHIQRFRALIISGRPSHVRAFLTWLTTEDVPNLQTIVLNCDRKRRNTLQWDSGLSRLYALSTFSPGLGFIFKENFNLPPALRILEIGGALPLKHTALDVAMNVEDILSLLATVSGTLEELRINERAELRGLRSFSPRATVHLSALRVLHFSGRPAFRFTHFFSMIPTPALQDLSLSLFFTSGQAPSADWAEFELFLTAALPHAPTCQTILLTTQTDRKGDRDLLFAGAQYAIEWASGNPKFADLISPTASNVGFALSVTWIDQIFKSASALARLIAAPLVHLPTHRATELALLLANGNHTPILTAFPNVETLIQLDLCSCLLAELAATLSSESTVYFPKLQAFKTVVPSLLFYEDDDFDYLANLSPDDLTLLHEKRRKDWVQDLFGSQEASMKAREDAGFPHLELQLYTAERSSELRSFVNKLSICTTMPCTGIHSPVPSRED